MSLSPTVYLLRSKGDNFDDVRERTATGRCLTICGSTPPPKKILQAHFLTKNVTSFSLIHRVVYVLLLMAE